MLVGRIMDRGYNSSGYMKGSDELYFQGTALCNETTQNSSLIKTIKCLCVDCLRSLHSLCYYIKASALHIDFVSFAKDGFLSLRPIACVENCLFMSLAVNVK